MNSTMASFVLHALGATPFDALFQLDDTALAARQMARVTANTTAGFPCRVSLVDADVGDELLLLSYLHQHADSPYRASGPIFVKRGARRAVLAPDEVPAQVQRRLMSLRAYNAADRIVAAESAMGAMSRTGCSMPSTMPLLPTCTCTSPDTGAMRAARSARPAWWLWVDRVTLVQPRTLGWLALHRKHHELENAGSGWASRSPAVACCLLRS